MGLGSPKLPGKVTMLVEGAPRHIKCLSQPAELSFFARTREVVLDLDADVNTERK